jgi:hypothetical protein
LTLPESRQLTEHLSQCQSCSNQIKRLETTVAALKMPLDGASELAALEHVPAKTLGLWKKTEQRRRLLRASAIAMSAAAAVLALVFLPPRHRPPQNMRASLQLIDSDLDEPLTIAEPISAAILDSEMTWTARSDLSVDRDFTTDGLGAE